MTNPLAYKVFGRMMASEEAMVVLIESGGPSSGNLPATPTPELVDFTLSNLYRSVKMLQDKNIEGYVLFVGDTTHYPFTPESEFKLPRDPSVKAPALDLAYLDVIAREAWEGKFDRVGVLSTGERLYVALASGRMRELAPSDSIAYAVDRVGPEWMAHMLKQWRSSTQPKN